MPRRFTVLRIALGGLLLAAAGLKLYGLSVSAIPRVGWFSQTWVQLAAVEWELILGLWLLSGAYPRGSWLAALGTFAAFAAVSGYLGWIGVASCGCFGVIQASPWWAFGVDVTVLLLLAVVYPDLRAVRGTSHSLGRAQSGFAGMFLGAGVILVVSTGIGTWVYGSPAAALARLEGESDYAPEYVDFGATRPGDELEREVAVTNWTDEPIRLIGGTSDCSCITTAKMPLIIGPGETVVVPVRLKVPDSAAGAFTRRTELLTDHPQRRTIRFTIGCRIE